MFLFVVFLLGKFIFSSAYTCQEDLIVTNISIHFHFKALCTHRFKFLYDLISGRVSIVVVIQLAVVTLVIGASQVQHIIEFKLQPLVEPTSYSSLDLDDFEDALVGESLRD